MIEILKTIVTDQALYIGRSLKMRHNGLIFLAICSGWSCQVQAEDAPLTTDPTRAQQPLPNPSFSDQKKKGPGFVLPKVQPAEAQVVPKGNLIKINKVVIEGNTVFTTSELDKVVAEYLNRQLRASDIEAIRRQLTQYYTDHGYVNSGAVLQSQSLADGILKIKVIEGRLTKVRQTGQERLREGYIGGRLMAGSGDTLNVTKLQDSFRLLLGDPLIQQLNGQLLPGEHLGEATLDVVVKRARPYQLYFGADDYQTPAVGAYTGRIGGWVDNVLTLGERIDAQFIVNGGALGYNTGIDLPLTAMDTRFNFRYSDSYSTIVEPPLDVAKITNHIVGYDGGFNHPVYRTFADEVRLGINFVVRQAKTEISGVCIPTDQTGSDPCGVQATVLRMSQNATHRGDSNNVVLRSTFNVGLDALGATTGQHGLQSGQFFSWLGQSMFSQRLMDNGASMVVKANIQLADKPLLSLERYAIGGVYTVRGYRENTYIRDNGFNSSLEFKYPLYSSEFIQNSSLNIVPFVDYGSVWNTQTPQIDNQPTNNLFSSGIGLNWIYKQVSTDFYWAHAFTSVNDVVHTTRSIQDDGIHFRVLINAF
jgi:hemolysin activation/secretion protein